MTQNELWVKINEENNGKIGRLVCYLYERWQDEKEYEDINDYLKAIQAHIPEAFKMHKRPFGFTVKCDDGNVKISVKADRKHLHLTATSV